MDESTAARGDNGNGNGNGPPIPDEDREIGQRVRTIRKRRGLSIDVVAGLAGLSKGQLSKLETGQRAFIRRGLLEDLAGALSCSVSDLTGQPYLAPDQQSAMAASAIPALLVAVHDATLVDAPDGPAQPVHELAREARQANELTDQVDHISGGRRLAEILTELQIHVCRGDEDTRRAALPALVEACMAAQAIARDLGSADLALTIARRGYDAARMAERGDLVALMAMNRGHALMRIGARYQAASVLSKGIEEATALPGPTEKDTTVGEARGMLHLSTALLGARDRQQADTAAHLEEARALAAYTGERNHMYYHFGPSNVAAWELAIGVENEAGPEAAERFLATNVDVTVLGKGRESHIRFDLARAWAQAGGDRDDEAIRALDAADRLAPLRTRNDPLARDLAADLRRRARRRLWELDSLCNRFGVA
jgi:transcriptional regulator with XRE-family HTH domain